MNSANATLTEDQDTLDRVFFDLFGDDEQHDSPRQEYASNTPALSDNEIIDRAHRAKNGLKFKALYNGSISGYPSPSEAESALAMLLAFWTDDESQIERIMRRTNLERPKWNEARGRTTYIGQTISNASRKLGARYTPSAARPDVPAGGVAEAKPKQATPEWPDPPGDDAYQGLAGEVCAAIDPYTESDMVAVLVNLLLFFGNAIGQGPHALVAATRHDPRTNAVLVGRSSKARKGDSVPPVRALFERADPEWAANCVHSGVSSGEGLVHAVRDAVEKLEKARGATEYERVVVDEGVSDKRLLANEPEWARVLQSMSRQGNTLNSVIRDSWDRNRLQVMTKSTPLKATGAHISIIGHITVEELRRELTNTDAANGFANRFLWTVVRRSKELPEPEPFTGPQVDRLGAQIREVLDFARTVGRMDRDPEARALWRSVYSNLSAERDGLAWAVLARAEAQVLRLSMLYALLDKSALVRARHLIGALELWGYSERSVLYIFGDATGDAVADTILDNLKHSGSLTRTQISQLFSKHVPAERITVALALLEQRGKACSRIDSSGGGRPIEMWLPTH